MLDELLKLAAAYLEAEEADIEKWRTETALMTDNDDVGLTRRRQLSNPTKSATPIDQQIDMLEQTYWNMEKNGADTIRSAMIKLLALARETRGPRKNVGYSAFMLDGFA